MKKKRFLCFSLSILTVLSLSGCTQLTPLTEEQEEAIVMYSADVVSRYNSRMSKGYYYYYPPSEEEEETKKDTSAPTSDDNTGSSGADSSGTTDSENGGGSTAGGDTSSETTAAESTLTDLIGMSGLSFGITKSEVVDHYTVAGVMDLSPGSGKKYFLLHITAVNNTGADITLDMPSLGCKFSCAIGDASVSSSGNGFVSTELSSWKGTIPAGGSQELLLFFPFADDKLTDTSVFYLKAEKNGTIYRITQ